jgi:amino acid permease
MYKIILLQIIFSPNQSNSSQLEGDSMQLCITIMKYINHTIVKERRSTKTEELELERRERTWIESRGLAGNEKTERENRSTKRANNRTLRTADSDPSPAVFKKERGFTDGPDRLIKDLAGRTIC